MNDDTILTRELREAVDALAENLVASEPFFDLEQAYTRLRGDAVATDLLQQLKQADANLRQRQNNGGFSQAEIADYRALGAAAQANPLIAGHEQARQAIQAYLQEVNRDLSQALGVDFAGLAKRSGCC